MFRGPDRFRSWWPVVLSLALGSVLFQLSSFFTCRRSLLERYVHYTLYIVPNLMNSRFEVPLSLAISFVSPLACLLPLVYVTALRTVPIAGHTVSPSPSSLLGRQFISFHYVEHTILISTVALSLVVVFCYFQNPLVGMSKPAR